MYHRLSTALSRYLLLVEVSLLRQLLDFGLQLFVFASTRLYLLTEFVDLSVVTFSVFSVHLVTNKSLLLSFCLLLDHG